MHGAHAPGFQGFTRRAKEEAAEVEGEPRLGQGQRAESGTGVRGGCGGCGGVWGVSLLLEGGEVAVVVGKVPVVWWMHVLVRLGTVGECFGGD